MKKVYKNKYKAIFTGLLPIMVFLFVISLLIFGLKSYLDNAAYFRIKKVVLNGLDDEKFAHNISERYLYGNIFGLNLKKIREDLKISNPQFYDVALIKEFPDQLTINISVRRPMAQVKQKGFFLVDSEGVIVSNKSVKPFKDSLVISGLRFSSELSFGKKINLDQIKSGLKLAQSIEDIDRELISLIPGLTSDKIEIDVSNHPSLYVYCNSLELRFYDENLYQGLESLKMILPTLKEKISQVKYIDLRFEEPAVSFNK